MHMHTQHEAHTCYTVYCLVVFSSPCRCASGNDCLWYTTPQIHPTLKQPASSTSNVRSTGKWKAVGYRQYGWLRCSPSLHRYSVLFCAAMRAFSLIIPCKGCLRSSDHAICLRSVECFASGSVRLRARHDDLASRLLASSDDFVVSRRIISYLHSGQEMCCREEAD